MAGLQVGQAYGVFHRPGFGLLVSVPRSLHEHPTSICDTGVNLKFLVEFPKKLNCLEFSRINFGMVYPNTNKASFKRIAMPCHLIRG